MKKLVLVNTRPVVSINPTTGVLMIRPSTVGGGNNGASALAQLSDWPQNVSAAEVGFLNGVTSSIQSQLTALANSNGGVAYANSATEATALRAAGATFIMRLDLLNVLPPSETVPPVITSFTIPATSNSQTVPITTFYATDAVGVTGWQVTESTTPPTSGWLSSAPTSFVASSAGLRTLYAWARDAAGNVSSPVTAQVTITLADTTAPVVSAFDIPATSGSLTVSITTLTASDNVAVTQWLVNESAATPLLSDAGWTAVKPTQFTFSATGSRTAYAWVRDAAGNISAALSDTVVITPTDVQIPVVQSFNMPASSTGSLTVAVNTFTATDNVGVTGYLITETNTQPAAGAAGWSGTAPTSFTFSGTGSRSAYPWVKDAAGNVSALFGSPAAVMINRAPTIPLNLVATQFVADGSGFRLNWSQSVDADLDLITYQVYKNGVSHQAGISALYLDITGQSPGSTATWTVRAVDANSNASAQSSGLSVTTIPAVPSVSVTSGTAIPVVLDWADVAAAMSYSVYRSTSAGLTPGAGNLLQSGVSPSAFTDSTAATGTTYYYRVIAVGVNGSSVGSTQVSVSTAAVDSTAPTISAFTANIFGLVATGATATATDAVGVTGYMIRGITTAPAATSPTQADSAGTSNGWQSTIAACTFTASGAGTIPIYLFARDAAGNVSNAFTVSGGSVTFTGGAEAPTVFSIGAMATNASGNITPTLPAHQAGDILVFVGKGQMSSIYPSGYTGIVTNGMGSLMAYKRAANSSEAVPTFITAGTLAQGFVFVIRGCVAAGSPIEAVSTGFGSGTNPAPAITTLGVNRLIIGMTQAGDAGLSDEEGPYAPSGITLNTPTGVPTSLIKNNAFVSSLSTILLGVWSGIQAAAGSTGTMTANINDPNSSGDVVSGVQVAFKP